MPNLVNVSCNLLSVSHRRYVTTRAFAACLVELSILDDKTLGTVANSVSFCGVF